MTTAALKKQTSVNSTEKKKSTASNEVRVQLILSSRSIERLDSLKRELDASSRAEVLRISLGLLEKVKKEISDGAKIISINENGEKKEIIPLI